MGALKDDCFSASDDLMALDVALRRLQSASNIVCDVERVPLGDALGRTLSETIMSPGDVPPHDNAAVDGYAVYFDDLDPEAETRLNIAGRIAAGHPLEGAPERGKCWRIFTGAPMPKGKNGEDPDTIFMQEDVTEDGNMAIVPAGIKRGANRRLQGEDIATGDAILKTGSRLRAQEVGLAASIGRGEVEVFQRLRVAIFSTGDEVYDPAKGTAPAGGIYDVNRYGVGALLNGLGCAVTDLGILPDDAPTIRSALEKASHNHDLLITSGGVSQGEEDHVAAVVETLGKLDFWRLAIKPGRPIALGTVQGTAFVGLPGNPVAAMVTFMMIARPLILRLGGRAEAPAPRFRVPAAFAMDKKPGRVEWLRASLKPGTDGALTAHRFPQQGAGILSSMTASDGLVEVATDTVRIEAGDLVDFIPFGEVT